ncbi:MAG: hypothetical protein K1X31_00865, partial [Gemmatimonadaceae bacterium]|nr:hypothetical protein [Gemmatimonadaceae bacterium]
LGLTPRLAHLVLIGAARGIATLASELAALLAERDVLRREAAALDADIRTRVDMLRARGRAADADRGRLERVRQEARALRRALGAAASDASETLDEVGALLALAYPDRVAMRRPGDAPRFLLRNGRGARLDAGNALARAEFLAIADLDGDAAESRIWLAAPLDEAAVREALGPAVVTESVVAWDARAGQVRALERERAGALVLKERPLRDVPSEAVARALVSALRDGGIAALPWSDAARALRARLAFAHHIAPETYPDVSDVALLADLEIWLAPALAGMRKLSEVARADLGGALLGRLPWAARSRLEALAPTHLEVPSGSRIALDYTDPAAPALAVRLQEIFGWPETPRIGEGRVPVTLQLLSPAHRPVQVTRDLASFWRSGYFEVRKDLKGRYPRHPWPDDPLAAEATRRAKPRGT